MSVHEQQQQQREDHFIYSHPFEFPFERNFPSGLIRRLFFLNFRYMLLIAAVYLIAVLSTKSLMKTRRPFFLRRPLIAWNVFMSLFSLIGAIRSLPELLFIFNSAGLRGTICEPSNFIGTTGFWSAVFVVSKVPEFTDTFFLVLRKKPVIFLHVYHHVETCLFCFFIAGFEAAVVRWYVSMNFAVHAFMYGYYALRASGIGLPRSLSMAITFGQTLQMFIGLFVTVLAFKWSDSGCANNLDGIKAGLFTYSVYLVMFSHYFVTSYFSRAGKKAKRPSLSGSNGTNGSGPRMPKNAKEDSMAFVMGFGRKANREKSL